MSENTVSSLWLASNEPGADRKRYEPANLSGEQPKLMQQKEDTRAFVAED